MRDEVDSRLVDCLIEEVVLFTCYFEIDFTWGFFRSLKGFGIGLDFLMFLLDFYVIEQKQKGRTEEEFLLNSLCHYPTSTKDSKMGWEWIKEQSE